MSTPWLTSLSATVTMMVSHHRVLGFALMNLEYIASGGNSSLILLHSLSSLDPEPVHTLIGHSLNVSTMNYSSKRQKLISGSWDRTARIWGRASSTENKEEREGGGWECMAVLEEHEEAVWGVLAIDAGPEQGGWLTASGMSLPDFPFSLQLLLEREERS